MYIYASVFPPPNTRCIYVYAFIHQKIGELSDWIGSVFFWNFKTSILFAMFLKHPSVLLRLDLLSAQGFVARRVYGGLHH
jgi:hypothetical protein